MQEISKKLGKNLEKVCAKKKLSQGALACLLEVDKGYVSNIESDGTFSKEKLLEQCENYLKLFGISKEDLISVSYSDLLLKK